MSKHTPGLWTVRVRSHGFDVGPDRAIVAVVRYEHEDARRRGNDLSNARLIAAAPGLLEACRSARSAIVLGNGRAIDWNAIADELSAAIAKATGKAK